MALLLIVSSSWGVLAQAAPTDDPDGNRLLIAHVAGDPNGALELPLIFSIDDTDGRLVFGDDFIATWRAGQAYSCLVPSCAAEIVSLEVG